jgi:hypothetical protein
VTNFIKCDGDPYCVLLVDNTKIQLTSIVDGTISAVDIYTASGGWVDGSKYRTIKFVNEPVTLTPSESDFLTWLRANAAQIVSDQVPNMDVIDMLYGDLRYRIDQKASTNSPEFTGIIKLGSTVLTEQTLSNLVNMASANGASF